jgi:glycosyltransferase involved in cell wall biosynthesis
MKNILHCTSWLSGKGGGIPPVIRALQREQLRLGWDVKVAGLLEANENTQSDCAGRILGPASFGFSPELRRAIAGQKTQPSLVHTHGLWMYPGLLARQYADRAKVPRIVSPHGMLELWALKNSRWKKQLAAWGFERRNLESAACLQASCHSEAMAIRAYGLKNPIAIIPNGIDLPDSDVVEQPKLPVGRPTERNLLYLGRIHPKKGLGNLLKAWERVQKDSPIRAQNWLLRIVGWDQGGHEQELRELVSHSRLDASVRFLGPRFGEAKCALFTQADAFVLPSFSEGLPIAVLEAWSYGKPVLITPECHLPEGYDCGAALKIEPAVSSIAQGLQNLFEMCDSERAEMGACGRRLVAERFTWPKIAGDLRAVYEWAMGGGRPPGCVEILA